MKRTGSAEWTGGGLKDGKGTVSTESGAITSAAYSFSSRFGDEKATNPEELLGAAHAGCFAMALSKILDEAGHPPKSINAKATVTLEKGDAGVSITGVHLDVTADVPGAEDAAFADAANKAKDGCPVSALFNTTITMDASLASSN